MKQINWILIVLIGLVDLTLIVIHFTNYHVIPFQKTGYLIPIMANFIIFMLIVAFSKIKAKGAMFIMLFMIFLPLIIGQTVINIFSEKEYLELDSPHHKQSLIIEYSHFTKGETTYRFNFYETKYGILGKLLEGESFELITRNTTRDMVPTKVLGIGEEDWMGTHAIRLFTEKGIKEIKLTSAEKASDQKSTEQTIEGFMQHVENNKKDQLIWVKRNKLTTRYDENAGQRWIDVSSEYDTGQIPRQQCDHIEKDLESGYYKLIECTHQWEYWLYPIMD